MKHNPGDRWDTLTDRLIDGRARHRHLDEAGSEEFTWLLWEAHEDDTCGCLKFVVWAVQEHDEVTALELLRNCIAEHYAGQEFRAADIDAQLGGLE